MRLIRMLSPGRLIFLVTLAVAGYLLFSAGGNVLHSFRLQTDEARLKQEVQRLRSEQDQLLQVRDYLRTDDYVEFMARRVFGLVKPGETLVAVDAPRPPQQLEKDAPGGERWWQRLFGR
jgi:cell division protein FtsB